MDQVADVPLEERAAGGQSLNGIGGWLLLFTLGMLPHLLMSGMYLVHALRTSTAGGAWFWISLLTFVGHGIGLALILRRHPLAPAYFTIYLPLSIAAALLTPGIGAAQAAEAARLGMTDASAEGRLIASAPRRVLVSAIVSAVYLGYWIRSRRVRATFGSAGLEAIRGRRRS